MAQANQATLSVRLNSEDKKFEEFCSRTGMNVSVCVNIFVKAVLIERKLPFEITQIKAEGKQCSKLAGWIRGLIQKHCSDDSLIISLMFLQDL